MTLSFHCLLNQCKEGSQSRTRRKIEEDDDIEVSTYIYTNEPSTSSGLRNDRDRRAKERATKKLMTNQPKRPTTIVKGLFAEVLRVGEEMNPVTFELPPELQVKVILPGDDKSK